MKILFLDFDGVLNNFTARNFKEHLSPSSCEALNSILEREPDLKIVISSAWRTFGLTYCQEVLQKNGIDSTKVIDITGKEQGIRGYQIQCWLDRNPGITNIVIIDDESDMGDLMNKLAKTNSFIGLTSKEADQAIEILKKPIK